MSLSLAVGAIAGSKEPQTCGAAVAPPPRTAPPRPDGRASLSPDPASPAARDPRGCSSPFPRRASLRRRLRPRENAATLLRGARARLGLLAAAALPRLAALLLVLAASLAVPLSGAGGAAHADVLVSNIGHADIDGRLFSGVDAAQSFTTGTNATGYTLTSIELRLNTTSVAGATPTVKLFSGSAIETEVATLMGPAMLDASATKNYAFTPSTTVNLLTSTTYWVFGEGGGAGWTVTNDISEDATSATDWEIGDVSESRVASFTGAFDKTTGTALQIRVNGTPGSTTVTTSSDATLSALALEDAFDDSAITISPVFASGTTSYTASVGNGVDKITIKPTVNEDSATVEYLDSSDTEIADADAVKAGQQVSLSVGATTIKVKVTAEDTTTTNPYTVVVTRAANTAPVFATDTTSRSFFESVGNSVFVSPESVGAVVTATDADGDTLTYSLEGTDAAKFGIVSSSGQIRTKVGREIRPGGQGELLEGGDGEGRRQQRRLGHDRGDDQR